MNTDRPAPPPARISPRFIVGWSAFCTLMVLVAVQEEVFDGRGASAWRLFDEVVAMLAATVVAVLRWRRGPQDDHLLDTPARWFWRAARWAPLAALAFVLAMYGMRHAGRAALGEVYLHPPWPAVLGYEMLKFGIFYLLFVGVQFGLRSHSALAGERERAEHAQRLLSDAQLAQLTQQMQPHFLFNALNTIAALVHDDPQAADTALLRLASLLRAATDARPLHPLADEMALAHSYAGLMEQRFGDRLQIAWHEEPGLGKQPVPALSLQPLLENCFVHGVEKQLGPTAVAVAVWSQAGLLCIEVDCSAGHLQPGWVPGVGIGNLQQRLRALHGNAASLHLLPGGGGHGVRALLKMPLAAVAADG